jgi:two-component system chemotaxis sensor kinase CheA
MSLGETIRRQLINSFKVEQKEHLQKISQGLLILEEDPAPELQQTVLSEIFREAHSLKGAARAVGLPVIEGLGHAMEELLLQLRDGHRHLSPDLFDLLYQALDGVELVMEGLETNQSAPAKVVNLLARLETETEAPVLDSPPSRLAETGEPVPEPVQQPRGRLITTSLKRSTGETRQDSSQLAVSGDETIRVSVKKLDALITQFGELVGAKTRADQRLVDLRDLQTFVLDWQKTWLASRRDYIHLIRLLDATLSHERFQASPLPASGLAVYDRQIVELVKFALRNQEQLNTLSSRLKTFFRQISEDTWRLSLTIDEMQTEIKQVRMFPLMMITTTFNRMVRDLARDQGKQANLILSGSDIELDKRILEQIKDPLIHLLRNAVDHGLETVSERKWANKPAQGQITLSASQQGNQAVISVSDDGSGLNLAAIRQAAVEKAFLSQAEVEALTEAEVANLIFHSGFSTSLVATDISGRGVGLDVVRQNVEALQGALEINSEPGRGTTFTMTLPLSLATSQSLLVRVGPQTIALPLTAVERMLYIEPETLIHTGGKPAILYQGKPVALAWLEDLLELPYRPRERDYLVVVMISVSEKQLGLVVDDLLGEQELVVKNLGGHLIKVGGIAGATILGSGQIILVLHPADLIKLAARTGPRPSEEIEKSVSVLEPAQKQQKMILVVDDSITTRTLEKNILQAAGYRVRVATNGEEALAMLQNTTDRPHLVVSDIAMPRLDGFDLTQRMKQDPRYADIPIILVTSLESLEDKARGIEVGADGYVVKSSFDQGNLLEMIEQLI